MKTKMKQLAIAAVASVALGISSLSFADSSRDSYRNGYKGKEHASRHYKDYRHNERKYGHVKHSRAVYHNPRHGYRDSKRHYSKHYSRHSYHHGYRKGHSHRHYDHRRKHNDDIYLWLGGMYILNEALHHH